MVDVWNYTFLLCGGMLNCQQAFKEYRIVFITYVLAENLSLHLNLRPSSSLQARFLHDYFWLKILRYYSLKS